MGIFSGIEAAKATEGGNYLHAGVHDVEIVRLTTGTTRKGSAFFAADLRLIGTNSTEHRIGEVCNWFVSMDWEPSLGNIKAFAVACLSSEGKIDPESVTEKVMEGLVDKGGEAVVGTRLKVQVVLVETKSGGTFSKHMWFAAGAQIAA
jgi:hypothetical protein